MRGFRELDRVLRGEATTPAEIASRKGLEIDLRPLVVANLILAAVYGVCMGFFGLFNRPVPEYQQLLADAVKVPALFVLTLIVTFPSLYVFNALVGSRLTPGSLARLMAAALAILLAVLAAFGPIVAFFSVTTTSYPFIVLLNVAVFTISGALGLYFLIQTLEKLAPLPSGERVRDTPPRSAEESVENLTRPVALPISPPRENSGRAIFWIWLVVSALVGAQMSWVLRPFIGSPDREFTWFRPRESSFFEAVGKSLSMFLGVTANEPRYDSR